MILIIAYAIDLLCMIAKDIVCVRLLILSTTTCCGLGISTHCQIGLLKLKNSGRLKSPPAVHNKTIITHFGFGVKPKYRKVYMHLAWTNYQELNNTSVDRINNVSGIYRIAVKQVNGNLRVVYVGQSVDLHKRLNDYLSQNTENSCLLSKLRDNYCYFKVAVVSTQNGRDACERSLFENYSPECNEESGISNIHPEQINFD